MGRIVDLYAGPGGWSEALRLLGRQADELGVEWDEAACKTVGGYHAHRRRGEGACDDCRAAIAKYNAERKAVLRATEGARTA